MLASVKLQSLLNLKENEKQVKISLDIHMFGSLSDEDDTT